MNNPEIKIPQAEEFFKSSEIKEVSKSIKIEFLSRSITIIIAGLGLITVLAWDEALKDLYREIVANSDSITGKFGYALIITLVSVIVSVILTRVFMRRKIKSLDK
jgi:hypothetical protein